MGKLASGSARLRRVTVKFSVNKSGEGSRERPQTKRRKALRSSDGKLSSTCGGQGGMVDMVDMVDTVYIVVIVDKVRVSCGR